MAYQINAGPMNPIPVAIPNGGNWSFQLTPTDCPMVGILYQLTVYQGDSSGLIVTNVTQFTRSA
jgi:hypothetical protein